VIKNLKNENDFMQRQVHQMREEVSHLKAQLSQALGQVNAL